jgi:hypothetical protein
MVLIPSFIHINKKVHMYDPFGEEISHPPKTTFLADLLYEQAKLPVIKHIIERLRDSSTEIKSKVAHIASLLKDYRLFGSKHALIFL